MNNNNEPDVLRNWHYMLLVIQVIGTIIMSLLAPGIGQAIAVAYAVFCVIMDTLLVAAMRMSGHSHHRVAQIESLMVALICMLIILILTSLG